jgi:hypothetical protein
MPSEAEVTIRLNETGNGLIFTAKPYSRYHKPFKFPVVQFPADAREKLSANAKLFFGGADVSAAAIQDSLTSATSAVTEYLLENKADFILLDIDDKIKDLPWELARVEKRNSTWGKFFRAARLAKEFTPKPHQTGETWRIFYDPEIVSAEGLAYYRAVGCGRDEASVNDGGAGDALRNAIESNNIIQIASHCDVIRDRISVKKAGGEFLSSRDSRPPISPRMVILDCCRSAETPLFSFRDFFRNGCAAFIGHIGKMRVDDGYGSRFTKLFSKAFIGGKESLANSIKAGRDTDNLRDYSAVIYVWKGVSPNFTKNEMFGVINERPDRKNNIKNNNIKNKFGAAGAIGLAALIAIGGFFAVPKFFSQDANTPGDNSASLPVPAFSEVEYTDDAHVVGKISGAAPDEYGVALMILVGEGADAQFYIKPTVEEGVSSFNPDGSFDIQAYADDGAAKESDLTARMYSVFLVPKSFKTSELANASDYETVKANAAVSLEKQNITRRNSE